MTTTDLIGLLAKIELDNNHQELEVATPSHKDSVLAEVEVEQVKGMVVIYPSE